MRWRPPKYGNRKTVKSGQRFASKREAQRYQELMLLERAGKITMLLTQPRYDLRVGDVKVCTYVADFEYLEKDKQGNFTRVIEDCKGARTPVYKLKKALMLAVRGIEIRET